MKNVAIIPDVIIEKKPIEISSSKGTSASNKGLLPEYEALNSIINRQEQYLINPQATFQPKINQGTPKKSEKLMKVINSIDVSMLTEKRGQSYTVKELKEIAVKLGLTTTGKKGELISRILKKIG